MNLNQRRPLSSCFNPMLPTTKQDVVDACRKAGHELIVTRVNVGEWNEAREFTCNGVWLDSPQKGEKPNWKAMLHTVENS